MENDGTCTLNDMIGLTYYNGESPDLKNGYESLSERCFRSKNVKLYNSHNLI